MKTRSLGAHSGSLNKTLVARTRNLGASGDRAPVRSCLSSDKYNSSNTSSSQEKAVQDGLWTTLIGTTPKPAIAEYISTSRVCMNEILPTILKSKVDNYVKSDANNIRSMRVLYEGGLISKRKYTRNSSDKKLLHERKLTSELKQM